ncbi:MAG TPA: hypothetical protein VJ867_09030 [Gemmatimonadaceae bacterium]|nr:hypothetical protein [Gemmatimonadaceae bacterium]
MKTRRRLNRPRYRPRAVGDRRGFAMFMALGALVVIAILVAGSSFITLQESQLGQNQLIQSRALAAAEFGLNKIQADWDKTPNLQMQNGTHFDMKYAIGSKGDSCRVRINRLNNETFWLVSEGRAFLNSATLQSRTAVKRVSAFLRLRIPTIKANAAITAGGNVSVRGGADIEGKNTNPPGWSGCDAASDKPGVVVPSTGCGLLGTSPCTVTTSGGSTVDGPSCTSPGNPSNCGWTTDPLAADSNSYVRYGDETWNTLTAQANIITAGGTIGNAVAPDSLANGTCNKANQLNWGEPWPADSTGDIPACANYFPIVYSTGDITLNGNGRGQGILLVKGSITINGKFEWIGLVIVQNDIVRGNGSAQIYGGVMARNEVKADESTISGTTNYNYSACGIERAMRGSAQVVQGKQRAWVEMY